MTHVLISIYRGHVTLDLYLFLKNLYDARVAGRWLLLRSINLTHLIITSRQLMRSHGLAFVG